MCYKSVYLTISAGKELSSWLSACVVLLHAVLIVCVSFPLCLGKLWNSIVSVPDHCPFVYCTPEVPLEAVAETIKMNNARLLQLWSF